MPFHPKALVAIQAVMREGSVTAAARRIHRTQPAASRVIAQLESQLGFQLFRREGRRLVPTEDGIGFYREAERVLAALGEAESRARDIRQRRTLPLRILAQPHVVYGLLPDAIAAFARRRPDFRFSIEMRQREHISHWIANRQFDVGIAPQPVEHAHVEAAAFVSAPVFAMLQRRHRLARKAEIMVRDLGGHPLVATHVGAPLRARLDSAFAAEGRVAAIRGETVNAFSAAQLAARGLGIALADPFVAAMFAADPSVALRPFAGVTVDYVVLWPSGTRPSAMTLDFLQEARKTAAALIARASGGSSRGSAARRSPSRK